LIDVCVYVYFTQTLKNVAWFRERQLSEITLGGLVSVCLSVSVCMSVCVCSTDTKERGVVS